MSDVDDLLDALEPEIERLEMEVARLRAAVARLRGLWDEKGGSRG